MTKQETLQVLKNATSNCSCEDFEFRSYSGRGMYGKSCLAVETKDPLGCVMELVAALVSYLSADHVDGDPGLEDLQEFITLLRKPQSDSMGLEYIVYWPDVHYLDI